MRASLKVIPGVDQNRTPALNEAAISTSQLIRFVPDKSGIGLPQKLGGWTKFFANTIGSTIRALWAWADLNANNWLAVGAESSLDVILSGSLYAITPRTFTDNVAIDVSTVINTSTVTIKDTGSNITSYDSVYIQTQIAIGGLILYGTYATTAISADTYSIQAIDSLGAPALATATVNNAGTIPAFTTVLNSAIVTVTLAAHLYLTGDTFPVLVSTSVGGLTIYGNYVVTSVPTANTFTIQAQNLASSATTVTMNSTQARYLYYVGYGPAALGVGYGRGGYGRGGYGGASPSVPGTDITAIDWTLGNWGETLIANPYSGPIYYWSPAANTDNASVITNAPAVNHGMFIAMPQRQVIAWGSTFTGIHDPLLVRWSDVDDFTTWIASVTNQAGSYRIPRGSMIVAGVQGPQQALLWTDIALWSMQYTAASLAGVQLVYGFNEIGTGCGLIGRKAAGVMHDATYWMSQSQFFKYSNGGVQPIHCPIWDVIFQDIDMDYVDNIRAAPNSRFNEFAWFYPIVGSSGIPTKYVKYNTVLDAWDFGTLTRTAWIDQSIFGPPIGAGSTQYIYQHESSSDADGEAMVSNFTTGYFVLNEADVKMFVDQVWPDMKWGLYGGTPAANVLLTFNVVDYPGETPTTYGPFTLTQATTFITPRFRGRLVSVTIGSADTGSFWRLGNMRYRGQPDGRYY